MLPPDSSNTRLQPAGSAAAADSNAPRADIAQSRPTLGAANPNTRTIEAQVMAATMLAERLTSTAATPDAKANGKDRSGRPETLARGSAERSASASVNDTDLLVAVLMARPEGQTTAINRLANGEVPGAVLALVSADAAEAFPEIAGFKVFHIPLSPRSLKGRP
jgi:hypothetical protein